MALNQQALVSSECYPHDHRGTGGTPPLRDLQSPPLIISYITSRELFTKVFLSFMIRSDLRPANGCGIGLQKMMVGLNGSPCEE